MFKPNLTNETQNEILHFLLQNHKNGRLKPGATAEAMRRFGGCERTIRSIWKRAMDIQREGMAINVDSRKKSSSGRKKKYGLEDLERLRDVDFHQRQNLRSLSYAISIPVTSCWRLLKEGMLKRVSSSLKPLLTPENMVARNHFCRSFIGANGLYNDMYQYIHIDEKWFYITRVNQRYYLLPDEEPPDRSCKSKRFITKVMFMAAVARPRFDHQKKQYFDGKIGIWPFVFKEPAKRNSKNRSKGTLVTKLIERINAEETKKMLLNNVIPAIKEKWPSSHRSKALFIQQDNARPHCSPDDEGISTACCQDGWNISLANQPPNSPDLNVLDLGFFNAIQSLQHQNAPKTIDDLIECVQESFYKLTREKLDNVFLTLQTCMEEIIASGGGNRYKIQHVNKEKLRKDGKLPVSIVSKFGARNAANL